jgi:hypothetical protein
MSLTQVFKVFHFEPDNRLSANVVNRQLLKAAFPDRPTSRRADLAATP